MQSLWHRMQQTLSWLLLLGGLAIVGQYDLQPILPQLKPEIPLKLSLRTASGSTVTLNVPPEAVQEWHTVAVRSS